MIAVQQELGLPKNTQKITPPSLLRQIVDKVDEMDDCEKKLLLLTLKKEELSKKYKKMDSEISQSGNIITEDKIDKLVAATRKKMYEQKIRS